MFRKLKNISLVLAGMLFISGVFARPKYTSFRDEQEPIAMPTMQVLSGGTYTGGYVSGGNLIINLGDNSSGWVEVDNLYDFNGNKYLAEGATGFYVSLSGDDSINGIKTFQDTTVFNGDTYFNGTATYINSTILDVEDKNIFMGQATGANDITADGGGTLLSGSTRYGWLMDTVANTFNIQNASINIPVSKEYKINNQNIIAGSVGTSPTLGASQFAIQQYVQGELATGGNLITKVGNNLNLGGTSTAQVTMNMGADAFEIIHTDSNAEILEDEIIFYAAGAELNMGGSATLSSTVGGRNVNLNLSPTSPHLYSDVPNTSGVYLNYPNGFDPEFRAILPMWYITGLIQSGSFYQSNGSLPEDRAVDGNQKNLSFNNMLSFVAEVWESATFYSRININSDELALVSRDGTDSTQFVAGPTSIEMTKLTTAGTNRILFESDGSMIVTDTFTGSGLRNAADYSGNRDARNLVDKGYVDAKISNTTGNIRLDTAVNNQIAQDGYIEADFGAVFLEDDGGVFKLEVADGGPEFELVDESHTMRLFMRTADGATSGELAFDDTRGINARGLQYITDICATATGNSILDKDCVEGLIASGSINLGNSNLIVDSIRTIDLQNNIVFNSQNGSWFNALSQDGSDWGGLSTTAGGATISSSSSTNTSNVGATPGQVLMQAVSGVVLSQIDLDWDAIALTTPGEVSIDVTDGIESSQLYLSPGYTDLTTSRTGMVRIGDNHLDISPFSQGAHIDVKNNVGSSSYIEGILVGGSRGKLHLDSSLWYIGDGTNGIGFGGLRNYMTQGSQSIEVSNTATNISGTNINMVATTKIAADAGIILLGDEEFLAEDYIQINTNTHAISQVLDGGAAILTLATSSYSYNGAGGSFGFNASGIQIESISTINMTGDVIIDGYIQLGLNDYTYRGIPNTTGSRREGVNGSGYLCNASRSGGAASYLETSCDIPL